MAASNWEVHDVQHSNNKGNGAITHTAARDGRPAVVRLAILAFLVLLAAMAVSVPVKAAGIDHHPMRFDRLSLDEGLSQSNVLAILQDSEGLMWVGTENGLNRYDGYDFTAFRRQRGNPDALPNDFIFDIAEDAKGNLWIATNGGGLVHMDKSNGTFTAFRNDPADASSIGSNVVRSVFVDTDGRVLAGTRGAGLRRLDTKTGAFSSVTLPGVAETDSLDSVFALFRDSAGALWVGGDHGLVRLSDKAASFDGFNDSVRAIGESSDGAIWVGTFGGGLARLEKDATEFSFYRHDAADATSIASDEVTSILEDNSGRLWVGTTAGLSLVDAKNEAFVRFGYDAADVSSLSGDSITALYEDASGVLWVGTKTRGLNKWNPRTWAYGLEDGRQLADEAEEQAPNVTSFAENANGLLFVGTFGEGLNIVDRKTGDVTHIRHDPENPASISEDFVMSMAAASDGTILLGTMRYGIDRFDPETGSVVARYRRDADDPASISANGIMAIYEDSKGQVWAGTFGGGVSRLDPKSGEFTRFLADPNTSGSLSGNRVTAFAEDPSGRMWIGTDSAGLNLYDPETGVFHHFRHDEVDPATLSDDTIYSIKVDAAGSVWVGTRGGGLDRVAGSAADPEHIGFTNVSAANGLSNDVIYGIEIDAKNRLWLSTNFGINRYNPKTGEIKALHRRDGLQSEEFNFGAHFANAGGELFFGGGNGYNVFDPTGIPVNAHAPAIVLTGFFNGRSGIREDLDLNDDGNLELGYREDTISFEFAALDFSAPERNQYMYKLEGFDSEWVDLGNRRRVTFTNLDDGHYLLRVKAANSDGVWNEAAFALPVRVAPAPWDTWWAYLGYVAMVIQLGVLVWWAHRQKVRREEEYSRRLERAVAVRTEKLVERNQQLKVLNNALQESSLSDPLTGLRNRRFVFEEISRDFETVRRKNSDSFDGIDNSNAADLVFMMVDLDNFKPINDTYGHAAGDQMLLEVRDVLLGTCRRSDFVIRWGGDEFVVIAKQAKPHECQALAERIRNDIAQHNFALSDGQIVRTTCSIGFAAYPLFRSNLDESSLDQVIGLADALMYEAKKHRNAWAGMFAPNEAATSFEVEDDSLEPTSILFRARRAGNLSVGDDHIEGEFIERKAS